MGIEHNFEHAKRRKPSQISVKSTMPHRCVAGRCSNTTKDGVSLHSWPSNPQYARVWTRAVRNTRADFSPSPSSKLCSAHFTEDCFEDQTVIARSLGLSMKKTLKPEAVPTIFTCDDLPGKRKRREDELGNTTSSSNVSVSQQCNKQQRGAFRKREAARVCMAGGLKLAS